MPEFCGTSVDSGKLTSLTETWTAWRCVSYDQWGFILIRRYVLKTPWLLVFVGYMIYLLFAASGHSDLNDAQLDRYYFWTSRVQASFTIIKSRFIAIFCGNSRIFMHFSKVACIFYFYFSLESHPLNGIQGFRTRGCEDFRCFSVFVGKIAGIKATQPTQPTQGTPIC